MYDIQNTKWLKKLIKCYRFRWVSCQVDALRRCRRASSIREALDNLPETLDETYDRILLSIPHEDRKDALAALHFLAFSACPVSVADVAEAVIVDHHSCSFDPEDRLPDPFDIVDVLSTLVICSSTQIAMGTERAGHDRYPGAERATEIRLAHYSVQEYLLSDRIRKGKASAFHISVYEAHKSVAEMCLIYLLQFDRPDSISRSMILDTPLALYAAQYWFQHARIAFENPDHKRDSESNLTRLCVDLLSPEKSSSFINWLTLCDPCDRKRIDFGRTLENMAEPLHYACYAGLLEVVRILRDNGADVNSRAPGDKWVIRTPLKGAIQGSSEGVVGFLLASNVDINAVNDWGCTALHQAALQGNESIVKLLIEHGANTKARTGPTMPYSKVEMPTEDPLKTIGSLIGNFTGLTKREETAAAITHHLLRKQMHLESAHFTIDPITRWPRYGHCSVLRVLLYGGDKAELKFATGWTPLHEAAWIGHVGVVRLLRGIDVECKTRYGWTAILLAAWNGHKDVVRELVQSGATIDTRNVYGWTALHAASKRGHEDVVRFLLDNGADIEAETSYGWTALFGALGDEYDNTLALLLERGADPNAHNSFGGTALHRAARAGRRRSVELLLQAGADPSIKSAYGTTAIEETTFQGNETVVRLLSSSSEQPLDKADAREP